MIPPYRIPVLRIVEEHFPRFTVIRDTQMESDRHWDLKDNLSDVKRSWGKITFKRSKVRDAGTELHLPLLLFFQLLWLSPSVVVTTELGMRTLFASLYKRVFPSTGLVVWLTLSERTEKNRSKLRTHLRSWMLRGASIVVVSSASASKYVESICPSAKIILSAQTGAIDCVEILPNKKRGDGRLEAPLRFMFVGSDAPRKNFKGAVSILADWANNSKVHINLHVVGIPKSSTLVEASTHLNIFDHGFLQQSELIDVYDESDCLFFPTLQDEWGIVVNEAFARGLVVLGSNRSEAVVELVRDNINGFTFDPTNSAEVFAALDRFRLLAVDEKAFQSAREKALETAKSAHPKNFASALIESILKSR